ncbi:unnamed protein product [Sphagnum jensenii]
MCASRLDRDEVHSFVGHQAIKRFFDEQPKDVMYVAHNGISYDGPSIQRLLGVRLDSSNIVDTLVLSYLYDPAMAGGHSLETWGDRLRFPKGSWSDWSKYSIEQDEYCQQDVRLGKKVFKALVTRLLRMGCSELACEIEHQIREIIDEQQSNGWFFDIPGAQSLVGQLRAEQQALERSIRSVFPPRLVIQNSYIRRQKKDGRDYSSYLRHLEEYPRVTHNTDDSTYDCWDWEEFNIGSPQQRISRLLEAGYNPISFTPTGQPKVDEESLLAYAEESGKAEVRSIAEWIVLQGRSTMIEGWLNNVNYDDSCMHGKIFTCGATTRRMTHREPNTANIPKSKPRVKYGKECRSLWRARPGRIMVGYDAKGLEMRTLAHYLGTEEAIKLFTEGDPHMVNTRALGMPDEMRDITVKNGFYCLTYGGQDPKLGRTLRPELQGEEAKKYGKWARSILEKSVPGLDKLVAEIKEEYQYNGGVLETIDGGFARCPSPHAALNYKLQSAGAIVMKKSAILIYQRRRKLGLDCFEIANVHDEQQFDSSHKDADVLGNLCLQSMRDAGKARWAKIVGEPGWGYENKFKEWSIDVYVDEATAKKLKTEGLGSKLKDKGNGVYITFKRKEKKVDGTPNQPIRVVDHKGEPWGTAKIGNGSTVNVNFALNEYKPGQVNANILSLQVWDLVPYEGTVVVNGKEISEKDAKEFGQNLADLIVNRLKPGEQHERKFSLRMSNIGKGARQLWYEKRYGRGEKFEAPTLIKFIFGELVEQLVLFLVKQSGHIVTDCQAEVSLGGVKGHIDADIDGVTTDVKSASTHSFKKFADGSLQDNDPFGYIEQISDMLKLAIQMGHSSLLINRTGTSLTCNLVKPN